MIFKQFYLGCLAHASYLIGSEGEAAVVDPQRDVDQYIEEAERQGLRILYVLETHLHADFVSGHRELAERTGAEVVFGEKAGALFPHRAVRDGELLRIGSVSIRAMETPGHTPESVCWLVSDAGEPGEPAKLLSGDTLFIGDVGRPDLVGTKGFTPAMMAGMLYDSIHQKILPLPDDTEVFPAHGAGSACGRNISSDRSSTIGIQRRTNYALQLMTREQFIGLMTSELAEPPPYFSMDAEINRQGAGKLGDLRVHPLRPAEVEERMAAGAIPLDVREVASFGTAHLPRSVNIGLRGEFASWAGSLLRPDTSLVLVADGEEQVDEALMRLARVGLENAGGYLDGGVKVWCEAGNGTGSLPQIDVSELQRMLSEDSRLQVVDVRRPGEWTAGRLERAVHIPLLELASRHGELDRSRPTAVICGGGYRSSTAASILLRHGFPAPLFNVTGGMGAWIRSGYAVVS